MTFMDFGWQLVAHHPLAVGMEAAAKNHGVLSQHAAFWNVMVEPLGATTVVITAVIVRHG